MADKERENRAKPRVWRSAWLGAARAFRAHGSGARLGRVVRAHGSGARLGCTARARLRHIARARGSGAQLGCTAQARGSGAGHARLCRGDLSRGSGAAYTSTQTRTHTHTHDAYAHMHTCTHTHSQTHSHTDIDTHTHFGHLARHLGVISGCLWLFVERLGGQFGFMDIISSLSDIILVSFGVHFFVFHHEKVFCSISTSFL